MPGAAPKDRWRRIFAVMPSAQLLAEPSVTWMEAAVKAQYLIRRYAETAEAGDARKQKLIQRALGDLARLIESEPKRP